MYDMMERPFFVVESSWDDGGFSWALNGMIM